jgi:subtilase family serine protease
MAPARLFCCLAALAALTVPLAGGPAIAQAGSTAEVADTQPGWAIPANEAGQASNGAKLVFSVWLRWRNPEGIEALLAAQQDPGSAGYHDWLSPQEFRARFAPPADRVDAVSRWLRGEGFDVLSVPKNGLAVTASGTVAEVEQAFQIQESLYRLDGHLVRGPDADPRIPEALAGDVRAITGLDGAMALAQPRTVKPAPPPPVGRSVGPCSRYWAERTSTGYPNPLAPGRPLPWLICGYTPKQIASAYGIDALHRAGYDGAGQTIAITGAFFSPTIRVDVNEFSRRQGLPKLDRNSFREVVARGTTRFPHDAAVMQDWYIEQSLDVEWAHAVAPRADIVYVGAANDGRGLDLALNHAVDNRLADVISNSWGMPESYASKGEIRALDAVFTQARAQGIAVLFASGDYGDNLQEFGRLSAGFPDSSPLVTSVGGTSLGIGASGQRLFETGWGTGQLTWNGAGWLGQLPFGNFLYGGGGGISRVYARPSYQQGVVPAGYGLIKGQAQRVEPDVALVADPQTGAVFTQSWSTPSGGTVVKDSWIGGTSLATPIMAGIVTLADQAAGRPHGFLNEDLYRVRGQAFRDILPSDGSLAVLRNGLNSQGTVTTWLRTLDHDSSLRVAAGWDDVTGLGSPWAPALAAALR